MKENYQLKMEDAAGLWAKAPAAAACVLRPCSSSVLERLHPDARITVYFDNPNLDTQEEYHRRAKEEQRFVAQTGLAEEVVVVPYDPDAYAEAVSGLEEGKEGGPRCRQCFHLRLDRAARYAKEQGFDFYHHPDGEPLKNAALLNEIGQERGAAHGVAFLPSDFKKKEGYKRSTQLSRDHDLYRQDYCGCVYSKKERDERVKQQESQRADHV